MTTCATSLIISELSRYQRKEYANNSKGLIAAAAVAVRGGEGGTIGLFVPTGKRASPFSFWFSTAAVVCTST